MKNFLLTLLLLISLCATSIAQNIYATRLVSLHYEDTALSIILTNIEKDYAIQFAYSRSHIPLDALVNIDVEAISLEEALDILFFDSPISYAFIGDQIVLKKNKKKEGEGIGGEANDARLSSEKGKFDAEIQRDTPVQSYDNVMEERLAKAALPRAITPGKMPDFDIQYDELDFNGFLSLSAYNFIQIDEEDLIELETKKDSLIYEVQRAGDSVVSFFGKASENVNGIKVNLSSSIINKNLNGIQVGLINTRVEGDAKGVQVSLFSNQIKGKASGFQAAAITNAAEEGQGTAQLSLVYNITKKGFAIGQFSGISNIAYDLNGLQLAGFSNKVRGILRGLQFSFIKNTANRSEGAIQLAPISNWSKKGVVNVQFGLVNTTATLAGIQGGLVNSAKEVNGFQFGLVNIADTVRVGAPVSLITIVKKGYNHLEVGGDDAMHLGVNFKAGAKSFYNIVYAGKRFGENTWGLGYGIGTYITMNKRIGLNLEALGIHVNEKENWTATLNLLTRFRMTLDIRIGKRFSIFLGPEFNYMVSQLYDAETNTYGSSIAPYILDTTSIKGLGAPSSAQAWISGSAGFRF